MEMKMILKATAKHCGGILIVCIFFAASENIVNLLFPDGPLRWWITQIDFVLVSAATILLGLLFLNLIIRIVVGVIFETWKGFPNGSAHLILA